MRRARQTGGSKKHLASLDSPLPGMYILNYQFTYANPPATFTYLFDHSMSIQLRGMTWAHPRGFDPMVATATEFSVQYPEVSITWEQRSLQAFADHPLDDLAARYDLIVVDHPHCGFVARDGCLMPLDQPEYEAELAAIAAQSLGGSHESYQYAGRQWALAIDAATQVAAYRSDLIAMDCVPKTWDQVVQLAEAGRVVWSLKPVDAISSFNSLAANRGTPIATSHDRLIAPADGMAVLQAMTEVAQHVPREALDMSPPEVLDWMSRAENEQYAYCPLLYGYTNYARDGYAKHLVRFSGAPALGSSGPCGTQLGGTGIAVSAQTKHPEVAIKYAYWIAGASCQSTLFFDSGGQPGNAAAWDDDHCNEVANNFFRDTRATHDGAWIRPSDDGYLDFQDLGGNRIHEYLVSGGDAAEVVDDLNQLFVQAMGR